MGEGAHKLYGSTPYQQIIKVKALHIHKKYSQKTMKNDIGLIELAAPVMLSSKVNTVCLPQMTDGPANKKKRCYVTECKDVPNVCHMQDWKARCHEEVVSRICSKVCKNICK
ncbi:hypothetical protein QZH41_008297 [Actinostola sp. cb2023]|nr:hypothetical protein QZH41_008297 [Actinostola sp. cb2023]